MTLTVKPSSTSTVAIEPTVLEGQETRPNTENCQPPTSPGSTLSISQLQVNAKDCRAYEVARQRAKHSKDRCKVHKQKGKPIGKDRSDMNHELEERREAGDIQAVPQSEAEVVCETETKEIAGQITVHLEDLIRIVKVHKEKAGDFELVPHVRAVIALDESDFAEDAPMVKPPEFDDWEHVGSYSSTSSGDEDEPRKGPSYAEIASGAKHSLSS